MKTNNTAHCRLGQLPGIRKRRVTLTAVALAAVCALTCKAADASIETITFSAPILSSLHVANAGSAISGTLTFDPNALTANLAFDHFGQFFFGSPATFDFTTDGGFSQMYDLTAFNVEDKFENGVVDYYVFDADIGVYALTDFYRLELTVSDNHDPHILNTDVPSAINPGDFEFHSALFDHFSPSQELLNSVFGSVSQVSVSVVGGGVPEPRLWIALMFGFGAVGALLRRIRKRAMLRTYDAPAH